MGAALLYTKNTFKTPLNGIENPVLDKEGKKIYFPNQKKEEKEDSMWVGLKYGRN